MSKIDSETKKNYANEHPSKTIDSDDNIKLAGTSTTSDKKYLKKIMTGVRKKYNMKPNTGTFVIQDISGSDGVPVHIIKRLSKD